MTNSIVNDGIVKVPAGGAPSAGVDTYGEKGVEQGNDSGAGISSSAQPVASSSVITGAF